MGIGLTLACADQEKIVWRFVSATISSAVIAPIVSVVVICYSSRLPGGELRRAHVPPRRDLRSRHIMQVTREQACQRCDRCDGWWLKSGRQDAARPAAWKAALLQATRYNRRMATIDSRGAGGTSGGIGQFLFGLGMA